jgi:hypothetical protein
MPGAVATATTANTSATPPISSRVGQNCRILDAAVTLLVLAFVTSWNPRTLLPTRSSPLAAMLVRGPAVGSALRLSVQSRQALRTVHRDRQLHPIPSIGQLLRPISLVRNSRNLTAIASKRLRGTHERASYDAASVAAVAASKIGSLSPVDFTAHTRRHTLWVALGLLRTWPWPVLRCAGYARPAPSTRTALS